MKIQMRRGLKADLPTLAPGEFGLCTDTKELYIGSPDGNVLVNTPTGGPMLLSDLTIDADKNWQKKNITNLGVGGHDLNAKLSSIITKLSELTIDADKDWGGKAINNPGNVDGVDISAHVSDPNAHHTPPPGGADPEEVRLPDPQAGDWATPGSVSVSSGGGGYILNQTLQNGTESLSSTTKIRNAQKITLTGYPLTYVRWQLKKFGSPTGTVYVRVRKVSDDSIIETSATTLDAATLTAALVWKEFALSCAPSEAVYVSCEYDGANGSDQVVIGIQTTDVCDGIRCRYGPGGPWEETPTCDMTIILFSAGPGDDAKDEDTGTYWQPSPPDEAGAWLKMDLGSLKFIGGCRIYWGSETVYRPTEYKIYTSPDDSTWTEVIHETEAAPGEAWKEYKWYARYARYIKLIVTTHGASGTKVYEVDEYSRSSEEALALHGHGGLS